MDLYACTQNELLGSIMKVNEVEVPCLKGLRLMSQEKDHDYIPKNLEYGILQGCVASDIYAKKINCCHQ